MAGLIPRVLRRRALFGEEKRTRCGVPRFARDRIRRVPYIGVPRAVVERRMQRGHSSSVDRRRECRSTYRTPTSSSTRPARDGWPAARKSAHGRRACRKAGAERGARRDGATRLIESRIVLELHAASVPHTRIYIGT